MEKEIDEFLSCYKWIHNTKVTDFFSEKIWENFPLDWLETLKKLTVEEMNLIPFGLVKEEWPTSFTDFLRMSLSFGKKRYDIKKYCSSQNIELSDKGITPKKLHEVERMASFLKEFLQKSNCQYVVDIGSGLAYLDLALAKCGFQVVGIEMDQEKSSKANKRAAEEGLTSNFESFSLEIRNDESSVENFENLIKSRFPKGKDDQICLVGLHCCGDLSPAIINIFLKVPNVKHLIFFGCCYHSMATEGGYFKNFPLSKKYNSLKGKLNCCSLRLGAQQTRQSWKNQTSDDHRRHMLNVSFRAILELAIKNNNCHFKKLRRKLAHVTCETTFESYVNDVLSRSTIAEWNWNLDDVMKLYQEYESFNKYIEPFTMMQVLFQPIIEYLILSDRCEYIWEHFYDCDLFQFFQDETSPRNCAIIANK